MALFANYANRVKAKWRRGSLFLEGTQNGSIYCCCHGDLVRDFLRAFVLKNGQRTEGWHGFWSDWIVLSLQSIISKQLNKQLVFLMFLAINQQ